nr:hypothetical protein [Cupriavidus campinensis]
MIRRISELFGGRLCMLTAAVAGALALAGCATAPGDEATDTAAPGATPAATGTAPASATPAVKPPPSSIPTRRPRP